VFSDVGEPLLHNAIGIAAQRVGRGLRVLDPHLEVDLGAGPPGFIDQPRDVRQCWLWSYRHRLLAGLVTQDSDDGPQLLECLAGRRTHQFRGLPYLFGRLLRLEGQRARVQRQQRDPVAEHVVHLARDPGALGQPDPVRMQSLSLLGPERPFAKCEQELPSSSDEHAPCGGCEHQRGDQHYH
jgi:hypothetical protein